MDKLAFKNSMDIVLKQRNLFLMLSILLGIANILLSFSLFRTDSRTILVPGISQEMTISSKAVSSSYIEEMSLMFLSNLLDLTPRDIGHKKELVLKYTSNNSPSYIKDIVEYFLIAEREYKRFGLTTYFTAKNLEIDRDNLTVIAHGILTSTWGKSGYKTESEDYQLEFDWYGGVLRLKSFERILSSDRITKLKSKEDKSNQILGIEKYDQNLDSESENDKLISNVRIMK